MADFFNNEIENGLFTDPTDILFVPNGLTALTLSNTAATFGVPLYGDGSGLTGVGGGSFTGGTVTGATTFTGGLTANTISATTYQNLPSLTPFKRNTTAALTGTLSETIITSVLIPANTFESNDWLKWLTSINATGNANSKILKFYFNTSAVLAGSTQVAQRTLANTITQTVGRNLIFVNSISSQKTLVGVTTNLINDEGGNTGTQATLSINFAVDQYFIISGTLANTGDTITVNGITSQINR